MIAIICLLALFSFGCETAEPKPPTTEAPTTEAPTTEAPTTEAPTTEAAADPAAQATQVEVVPLQHGSFLLNWGDSVIAVDPVMGALEAAEGEEPKADLVLLTDIHGDHLDPAAVAKVRKEGAPVIAPRAVVEEAGDALPNPTVMANGESQSVLDGALTVTATPMYNLERTRPDTGEPYHVKGRGNGYVLERDGLRVYISGDTECTPEMKALEDIDVALVTMNLPYTMTVEEAAGCIREFKPAVVYPFHYRGQDPSKLNELLADVPGVEVRLLEWYAGE
jgi:L-ascorbate metabolism protein UlaG (beta-lactamase superfamily)